MPRNESMPWTDADDRWLSCPRWQIQSERDCVWPAPSTGEDDERPQRYRVDRQHLEPGDRL